MKTLCNGKVNWILVNFAPLNFYKFTLPDSTNLDYNVNRIRSRPTPITTFLFLSSPSPRGRNRNLPLSRALVSLSFLSFTSSLFFFILFRLTSRFVDSRASKALWKASILQNIVHLLDTIYRTWASLNFLNPYATLTSPRDTPPFIPISNRSNRSIDRNTLARN